MAGPRILSRATSIRTRISASSPLAHPSIYRHLSSTIIASRLPLPLPRRNAQKDISYRPIPRFRHLHTSTRLSDIPQWPNPPVPQPTVTPYSSNSNAGGPGNDNSNNNNNGGGGNGGKSTRGSVYAELAASPIVQAAVTTAIGLIAV
jgi:hypothetical protein